MCACSALSPSRADFCHLRVVAVPQLGLTGIRAVAVWGLLADPAASGQRHPAKPGQAQRSVHNARTRLGCSSVFRSLVPCGDAGRLLDRRRVLESYVRRRLEHSGAGPVGRRFDCLGPCGALVDVELGPPAISCRPGQHRGRKFRDCRVGTPLAMAWFLPHLGRWHVLWFALATLVCVGVGTAGFARLRHGLVIDFRPIIDRMRARLRWMPVVVKAPFSSPQAAQLWLEWRERGWVLPAVVAALGIGVIVVAACVPAKEIAGMPIADGGSSLVVAVLFVIGFFWGNRSSTFEFRAFKGSRPLSDRQIAAAVLKSVTVGLISTGFVWAGADGRGRLDRGSAPRNIPWGWGETF